MKVFDRAYLKDPVGVAGPVYQYRDRDQVVAPSSLDQPSRELLLRAQKAIACAVDGEAAAIEPDGLVPDSTLLRHEWEIAVALRDITDLRAEHGLNAAASVGPMTDAVLKSQEGALVHADEAIAARVSELERYADCVRAASTAYRDWQDALRVSDLNDRYLDLVARTESRTLRCSRMLRRLRSAGRIFFVLPFIPATSRWRSPPGQGSSACAFLSSARRSSKSRAAITCTNVPLRVTATQAEPGSKCSISHLWPYSWNNPASLPGPADPAASWCSLTSCSVLPGSHQIRLRHDHLLRLAWPPAASRRAMPT